MTPESKAPKTPKPYGDLWYVKAKAGRGVEDFLIVASSEAEAEAVGRAWLDSLPAITTFIGVHPAVVATPAILAAKPEPVGAGAKDGK